jgi:DNA-binding transcriptional regulator YhcF (GntR family)
VQIHIQPNDGLPIYLQIVNQIRYQIAAGRLAPGDEIPPIRVLAEQLVINPNTVARAYLELERAGLVAKRQGSGTYVAKAESALPRREKLKVLGRRVDTLLAEASQLDVPVEEVIELLRERHQLMQSEP